MAARVKETQELVKKAWEVGNDEACLKELEMKLEHLNNLEDEFWKIRSMSNWLINGDKKTIYVHHHASQGKSRNFIFGLLYSNGVWVEDEEKIERVVCEHFSRLFTDEQGDVNYDDIMGMQLSRK